MIIFDTETTGLLKPEIADLAAQPHIIEIAMAKVDKKYKVVDQYEALLKPGEPIDEELHKRITGLTNADLEDKPSFLDLLDELTEFVLGEEKILAHNAAFDMGVLICELRRVGREYQFPYPPDQICSVNETYHLKGKRLRLVDLYEKVVGKKLKQKHRAMSDVLALLEVVKKLKL